MSGWRWLWMLTFLGGDTNVPLAVLQLFKVCKASESFYPPDLNGSKLFYCIKTLNLPQLWIMKTFSLWQILLWKPNIALCWVLDSDLQSLQRPAVLLWEGKVGSSGLQSLGPVPRCQTTAVGSGHAGVELHRGCAEPTGKRLQHQGVPALPSRWSNV